MPLTAVYSRNGTVTVHRRATIQILRTGIAIVLGTAITQVPFFTWTAN